MATALATYLNEDLLPLPFCPGCGHSAIVKHLDAALVQLQLDPRQMVLVTDIGCQGLADRYFDTNAFHGLHGRAVTYATGIKLANPDLKVIVLIGDGGTGIGGHHLLNAARRNIGITVLVFNNLNFGMTGGEHSVTTPPGARTTTTRHGHMEHPLDLCATVGVNGAGFAARATSFDKNLPDLIAAAIQHDGFALLDIWELCTAYFVEENRFSRALLERTMEQLGFATGILYRHDGPEYSRAARAATSDQRGRPTLPPHALEPRYTSAVETAVHCAIAGAAGAKIGSAASVFCQGAILSGLWATQRGDYPVTVKAGYSVADVVLSRDDAFHVGTTPPDLLITLFPEGLQRESGRIARLGPQATLFIDAALPPVETAARVVSLDFSGARQKKETWAVMAVAAMLQQTGLYPLDALREAAALRPALAAQNLAAIAAGVELPARG
jgi:pyruvate/2-oxoacid:ferredoxin oxidoreductase beta subunit/Pyruvate/2-oxoacid:ferredoxin oxidoreductase gamma subunit